MSVVAAAFGQAAITRRAYGHSSRGLITDVAIDVRIHYILSGCAEGGERFTKFAPVMRRVHIEKHEAHAVLQGPAQCDLARLARQCFRDDRPVTRCYHVQNYVWLSFDVNCFLTVPRLNPSRRRLVLPLSIELFDVEIFDSRANVGKSPPNALIVADYDKRNARDRNPGGIELAARCSQPRRIPKIGHLVVEMHV